MPEGDVIGEGRRLALLSRLVDTLGEEEAWTLVESLPPVPWDRLATKDDIRATKEDIRAIREDIRATKEDIRDSEERLRIEMNAGFKELRGELLLQMANLFRTVIFAVAGFAVAVVGAVVAVGFS